MATVILRLQCSIVIFLLLLYRFGNFQQRQPASGYPSRRPTQRRPSNPRTGQPGYRQPQPGASNPSSQPRQPPPMRINYEGTICQSTCICQESQAYCAQRNFRSVPEERWPEGLVLINFDQNLLTSLQPNGFNKPQLKTVKTAIFSFNQLTTIEANTFQGLSGMIELTLSSNKISTIKPGAFDGLTAVDTINLQKNKLKEIDEVPLARLFSLRQLKLEGNQLKTIRVEFFDTIGRIQVLSLGNNPWECDCNLLGLFLWASAGRQIQGNPTCSGPDKADGRTIVGFSYKEVQGMCKDSWEDETTSQPEISEEEIQVFEKMTETCSSYNATLPVEICFISEKVYAHPGKQTCLHCIGTSNNDISNGAKSSKNGQRGDAEELKAKINITWTLPVGLDASPSNTSRYVRHDNGTLCINSIQVSDGGEYICTAKLRNHIDTESVKVTVPNLPLQVALAVVGVFVTLLFLSSIMLLRWWSGEVKAVKMKKKPFTLAT